MKSIVKNTTRYGLLDLLCPHTCIGCGRLGTAICGCCKKHIIQGRLDICPLCKQVLTDSSGGGWRGCQDCESPFERIWVTGWREGALAKMVTEYKYHAMRALTKDLVEVLDETLPKGRQSSGYGTIEMVVVPLPTIGRHVRERGIDHTDLLARGLAERRRWRYQRVLERAVDTVQVGTKATERQKQAREAYVAVSQCDAQKCFLLLDDVWTTGATMLAAAQKMRTAGAKRVFGIVLATGKPQAEAKLGISKNEAELSEPAR